MLRIEKGLAVLMILLLGVSQATAGEWQIVGPRALGMGGANVAVANDATASYWNPAAFGFFDDPDNDESDYGKRGWSSQLGFGLGAQIHGNLTEEIDKVSEIKFDGIDDGQVSADKVTDFIGMLDTLRGFDTDKNRTINVLANSGFRLQFGHIGLGAGIFANVSATAALDLKNIGPGTEAAFTINDFTNVDTLGCPAPCSGSTLTQAQKDDLKAHLGPGGLGWDDIQSNNFINAADNGLSQPGVTVPSDIVEQIKDATSLANSAVGSGPISANNSELIFTGIALAEVPITYGRAITENLSIGGNLKFMKARVYNVSVKLFDKDFGDLLDEALDKYEEKTNVGLDLGTLYRFGDNLRVALVGRNLNSPKFGSFKEKPQLRTGFAYKPLSFITLAADLDLTKNDTTPGSNFESQNIGAGFELRIIKVLMIRGGVYRNLAESDIGLIYTGGLGLNLWLINIDLGGSVSKDKTDLDGDSIPEEVRVEFALSMLF